MSLRAAPSAPIPEETVRVAHAAFPKGTLCIQMRDTLVLLYTYCTNRAMISFPPVSTFTDLMPSA